MQPHALPKYLKIATVSSFIFREASPSSCARVSGFSTESSFGAVSGTFEAVSGAFKEPPACCAPLPEEPFAHATQATEINADKTKLKRYFIFHPLFENSTSTNLGASAISVFANKILSQNC